MSCCSSPACAPPALIRAPNPPSSPPTSSAGPSAAPSAASVRSPTVPHRCLPQSPPPSRHHRHHAHTHRLPRTHPLPCQRPPAPIPRGAPAGAMQHLSLNMRPRAVCALHPCGRLCEQRRAANHPPDARYQHAILRRRTSLLCNCVACPRAHCGIVERTSQWSGVIVVPPSESRTTAGCAALDVTVGRTTLPRGAHALRGAPRRSMA